MAHSGRVLKHIQSTGHDQENLPTSLIHYWTTNWRATDLCCLSASCL